MSPAKTCPQCNASYDQELKFCPRDGSALRLPSRGEALVGLVVAERYHVQRKLGEGGMGQVYLAEHVKMGRPSALKVMRASMMADAEAVARFNREASNASRISHPNVAAIYDFGETEDGLIYLAMEYVEGEPLSQLVEREGALAPGRAVAIAGQVASALDCAHDLGIVHRDLKPDNIMISRGRDGRDVVKVVDFGIAKASDAGGAQKLTRTGLVIGTPEYMSPEQVSGDRLDGRSDTYALGLVVFHMLTGALPFASESAQEAMIARLTDRPRTLAEAGPRRQWPDGFQEAIDRALARRPEERYACAGDLAAALRAVVDRVEPEEAGTPVGAMPHVVLTGTALPPTIARGPATALRPPAEGERVRVARWANVLVIGALLAGAGGASVIAFRSQQRTALAAAVQEGAASPAETRQVATGPATNPDRHSQARTPVTGGERGAPGRQTAVEPRSAPVRSEQGGAHPRPLASEESPSPTAQPVAGPLPLADADAVSEVSTASDLLQRAVELGQVEGVERAQRRILRALPRLRTRSDSVRAIFHLSEALIARGQEERACVLLHDIKDDPGQFRRAALVHYDRYCR